MANENILGKCFRSSSSLTNPRMSPLTIKYEWSQLSLLFITYGTQTNKVSHESYLILPCKCIHHKRMPETLQCLEVRVPNTVFGKDGQMLTRTGGPTVLSRNPTSSFLTATPLICAIGTGITVAAGTRFALQLMLVKRLKIYSFQLQDMDAVYCYFLSLPPCVRIGYLRGLLPSIEVVAVPQGPSPESNPHSLLPCWPK